MFKNEKGLTLLEVLLSIVILTIILAGIMNFFPQMGLINEKNIDKNQAINIAKDELIFWQNQLKQDFIEFHDEEKIRNIPNYKKDCSNVGSFTCGIFHSHTNNDIFDVKVQLNVDSELKNGTRKAYQIHIQIINDNDELPISETYGYVII